MTREELDQRIRTYRTSQRAIDKAEHVIRTSPVAQARETLRWLEGRALDGELAPGRELADYDPDSIRKLYRTLNGPHRG